MLGLQQYAITFVRGKLVVQLLVPGVVEDLFFSPEKPNIVFVNLRPSKKDRKILGIEYEGPIVQEIPHERLYSIFIASHEDGTETYAAILADSVVELRDLDFNKLSVFPARHKSTYTNDKTTLVAEAAVYKLDSRFRIAIASRIHLKQRSYAVLDAAHGRLKIEFVTAEKAEKLRETKVVGRVSRVCETRIIDVDLSHAEKCRDVLELLEEFARKEVLYIAYRDEERYLVPREVLKIL